MNKAIEFKAKLHDPKTASRKELVDQIQDISNFLAMVAIDFERKVATIYDHEKILEKLVAESEKQRLAWRESRTDDWKNHGEHCTKLVKEIRENITVSLNNLKIVIDEEKITWNLINLSKLSLKNLREIDLEDIELEEHQFSAYFSAAKAKLDAMTANLKDEIEQESKVMAIQGRLAELIRKQHPLILRLAYFVREEEQKLEFFVFEEGKKYDPVRQESFEKYLKEIVQQINALLIQEKKVFYDPFNELARQEVTPVDRLCEMISNTKKSKMLIDKEDVDRMLATMTEPEEAQMVISAIKSNPEVFTDDVVSSVGALWKRSRKEMEKVKLKATHDLMMGIKNRHTFDDELQQMIKEKKPLSLIMIDIDHFKQFNDTYGHQIGDKVLKEVAAILKTSVRQSGQDEVYRIGGEEIALILPGTNMEGAVAVAEKIRRAIESHPMADYEGKMIRQVTVSLGVVALEGYAALDSLGLDPGQIKKMLIKQTDALLYDAKKGGRNQVRNGLFSPTFE
ncbi:GGDEF domain-containing protein [Candidatus Woesearchaeota archaeon]|nr:GGDEF domain-containing protein [Candidatus Woesearchaeota archaeon]